MDASSRSYTNVLPSLGGLVNVDKSAQALYQYLAACSTTASLGIHYTLGPQEMPILNDLDNQTVIGVVMER